MYVLKHAVSYILSFVLVFAPTLAWAHRTDREQRKHKQHKFTAESTDTYDRQEERAAERAEKKQARAEKKADRRIASVDKRAAKTRVFKNSTEGLNTIFHRFRYKGQDISFSQVPSKDGKHAQVQMVHGPDFEEILVDEHNTGTASIWQLKKGDNELTATRPFHGAFTRIDVRSRRAKAYINTRLQLNPDFKTYRVVSYWAEPFHVDHHAIANKTFEAGTTDHSGKSMDSGGAGSTSINTPTSDPGLIVECVNQLDTPRKTDIEGLKSFVDTIQQNNQTAEDALTCSFKKNQNALLDQSCLSGQYKDSSNDIIAALAKIFSSVGSSPGRYLQCANEHGFAFYAAKMQGQIINDLPASTLRGGDEGDCKPDANEKPPSGYAPFVCSAKNMTTDGEFTDDAKQQVTLARTSSQMQSSYESKNGADAYASLIFHELLHKSGIPEAPAETGENVVAALQNCCADPDPNSADAKNGCAYLNNKAKDQFQRQTDQNVIDMYYPSAYKVETQVARMLGSATAGDDFMGVYYDALKKDPDASKAWQALQACDQAAGSNQDAITKCEDAAEPDLIKFNNKFFAQQCPAYKAQNVPGSTILQSVGNNLDCAKLGREFNGSISQELSVAKQQKYKGDHTGVALHGITVNSNTDAQAAATDGSTGVVDHDLAKPIASSSPITISNPNISLPVPNLTPPDTGTQKGAVADTTNSKGKNSQAAGAGTQGQRTTLPDRTSTGSNGQGSSGSSGVAFSSEDPSEAANNALSANANANQEANANGAQQAALSTPTYLPSSAASIPVANSSKPMPAYQPGDSAPVGSAQGQANAGYDVGSSTPLADLTRKAMAATSSGLSQIPSLVGSAAHALAGSDQALAAAYAPEKSRMPASVVSTSGSGGGPSGASSSAAQTQAAPAAVSRASQVPSAATAATASEDPTLVQQAAAGNAQATQVLVNHTLAKLNEASSPEQVLIALFRMGPALETQLKLGTSSKIIQQTMSKGWSLIPNGSTPVLKNPYGKCYAPSPPRALAPTLCPSR